MASVSELNTHTKLILQFPKNTLMIPKKSWTFWKVCVLDLIEMLLYYFKEAV